MKKVLGIVTARRDSKGVPYKNRRELGGRSITRIALEKLTKCEIENFTVILDTNDEVLLEQNERWVRYRRPEALSQDTTSSFDVIRGSLKYFHDHCNQTYDYVILLEPTCPFVTSRDIERLFHFFVANSADSAIYVTPVLDVHPIRMKLVDEAGRAKSAFEREPSVGMRRQSQKPLWVRAGGIYIFRTDNLLKNQPYGEKEFALCEDSDRFRVNIDTMLDWEIAASLFASGFLKIES